MQYFGFDRPSFALRTLGFGDNFDPLDLFTGGKQGVWYDPSDKSTLFQDVAGTIPVTKDGDPIGLMKDKSGNGYHATQSVSAARPLYKTDGVLSWFETDGVDDYLRAVFNQVIPQPFTLNLGVQVNAVTGNWNYVLDSTSVGNRVYIAKDRVEVYVINAGVSYKSAGTSLAKNSVLSLRCDSINSSLIVNSIATHPIDVGAGGMGGLSLGVNYVGNDATKVKYYGVIIVGMSAAERTNVTSYLAAKSGVTL